MKQIVMNLMKTTLLLALLGVASCSEEDANNPTDASTNPLTSNLETRFLMGAEVPVKDEGDGLFSIGGSDLLVFEEQLSDTKDDYESNPVPTVDGSSRLAIGGFVNKWTDNTVVYSLEAGLSQSVLNELQISMDEWTSKTNIQFRERTNEDTYVRIRPNGASCNCGRATLGSFGNQGFIELGSGSTAVVIIHEIGHTLGYIHEQNRADRNSFVIINFENIEEGAEDQFFISNSAEFLTSQFDINSTMMYGSFTFSGNGQPTIVDINGNLLPPRQAALSQLDIEGTNAAYPGVISGNLCDGVEEWNPNTNYAVGDRVTYFGNLFERDFTGWIFIQAC